MARAKPICNGTAGVNGPAQNSIIALVTVQYHGFITNAKIAVTMTGDQNINSAIITHRIMSLVRTFALNHFHKLLNLSLSEICSFLSLFFTSAPDAFYNAEYQSE